MLHSTNGGTGTGVAANLLHHFGFLFEKKPKITFSLFPSPKLSTSVVEPYNFILMAKYLLDYADMTMVYDNEALYNLCEKHLEV